MAARLLADALAGPQVQKIEQTLAQEHAQLSIMLEEEEDRALEREKNRAPLQLLASSPEVAAEVSKPVSPEHVVPGNTGQLAGVPPDGAA